MLVNMDSAHVVTGCKAGVQVMPASDISAKAATPSGADTSLLMLQTTLLLISAQDSVSSAASSSAPAALTVCLVAPQHGYPEAILVHVQATRPSGG